MDKYIGLFATLKPTKRKSSRPQKIFVAMAASASILASGDTTPEPTPKATENDDVIVLGADGKGGTVDALAGDDKITGGDFADFIRGNLGADIIDGGAGVDNIVVIGVTDEAGYTLSDIENPNGTGIDLSALLSLGAVNNNAISDIVDGEVIDGGADGARLFVFGVVDFSQTTLKNINRIDVQSEITLTAVQLKQLIDSGKFEALIGDGTSEIIISNDGGAVVLDFSNVDMQNVKQLNIAANVTLQLDQNDLRGMTAIKGAGTIEAVSGSLDLSGITVEDGIIVLPVVSAVIDLTAPDADVSHTAATSHVNATDNATDLDDSITAAAADMVGSHINGLGGTDSLTITGGLGVYSFDDVNNNIINVEKIILGNGVNTVSGFDNQVKFVTGGNGADELTISTMGQNFALGDGDDKVIISQSQLGDATHQTTLSFGQNGGDILKLTSAGKVDLTGGANGLGVAGVTGVDEIILTGETQLTYEETAELAVETGDGDVTVKTTGADSHNVNVDVTNLTADTLTLIGNDNYAVTGVDGNDVINASGQTGGTLTVTTFAATEDIKIKTSAAASLSTINAELLSDGNKIILEGAGAATVNLVAGDLTVASSGDVTVNVTGVGGTNEINLGSGADVLNIAGLTSADDVDGGDGADILTAAGLTSNNLDSVTNFETINLKDQAGDIILNTTVADTGETVTIKQTGVVGNHDIDGSGVNGNLYLVGDAGNSTFTLATGDHAVFAGAGADILNMTLLTSADDVDGGDGADILNVTAAGSTTSDLDGVTNFETINLINQAGNIILNGTVSDTGETVTINQTGVVGNHNIDAGAVNGNLNIVGDAGDSIYILGAGVHALSAGIGSDQLNIAGLTAADDVDGGNGADVMTVTGAGVATNDLDNVTSFETIVFKDQAGDVILNEAVLETGETLTVFQTGAVGNHDIDASALDGNVNITGNAGDSIFALGAGVHVVAAGGGADTLIIAGLTVADDVDGGDGADILTATGLTSADLDSVTNFETINLEDQAGDIVLNGTVVDTGETVTIKQTGIVGNFDIDASAVNGSVNIIGDAGSSTFTVNGGVHTVSAGDGDDIILLNNNTVTTIDLGAGADTIKWIDTVNNSVNNAGRAIINDFETGVDKLEFDSSGISAAGLSGGPQNPVSGGNYHEGSIASINPIAAYSVFLDTDQSYISFDTFEDALSTKSTTNGAAGIVGFLNSTSGHFELYVDRTLGSNNNITASDFMASFTDITDVGDIASAFSNTDFIFIV